MTPAEIVKRVTSEKEKARGYVTDRDVLGGLVRDCDKGQDFIEGDNCYVWYMLLGKLLKPKKIVEMGVRYGYSLRAICEGADHFGEEYEITAIDDERDGLKTLGVFEWYFREKMGIDWLNIFRVDTQNITRLAVTGADLVHVDAWHTENGCYHECGLALGAVKPGGVILVDDTNPGCVRDGCERFCKDHQIPFAFLPTLRGMHILTAPARARNSY